MACFPRHSQAATLHAEARGSPERASRGDDRQGCVLDQSPGSSVGDGWEQERQDTGGPWETGGTSAHDVPDICLQSLLTRNHLFLRERGWPVPSRSRVLSMRD